MALGFISTACTGFWGSYSFCVYTYLAQPRCSREGLGLSTKQIALPSLSIRGVGMRECVEGMGRVEGVGIWIGILKKV